MNDERGQFSYWSVWKRELIFTSEAPQRHPGGAEPNPSARRPDSPGSPPTCGRGSDERERRHRTSLGRAGSSLQEEEDALQEERAVSDGQLPYDEQWDEKWDTEQRGICWLGHFLFTSTTCQLYNNSSNIKQLISDLLNLEGSTRFVGSSRFGGRALSPENDEANWERDRVSVSGAASMLSYSSIYSCTRHKITTQVDHKWAKPHVMIIYDDFFFVVSKNQILKILNLQ